jgi:K+-sensing histidine kinase KdpD
MRTQNQAQTRTKRTRQWLHDSGSALIAWHSGSGLARTPVRGMALALVVVVCALIPRLLLHGVLGERSAFTLFILAVMVCVRLGGVFSAAAATGFSIVAATILFLGPARDDTERLADFIEIVLFAFVGLGITWLAQQLRAATLQAEEALEHVRTLTGLLPICAWCKKIRTETGQWQLLEQYFSQHSEAKFTHGLCQDCAKRLESEWKIS